MTQQPDNLFRSKLENYQMTAPANAWSKIEAGVHATERKGWIWMRIAAGVVLLMIAGLFVWNYGPSDINKLANTHEAIQENASALITSDENNTTESTPNTIAQQTEKIELKPALTTAKKKTSRVSAGQVTTVTVLQSNENQEMNYAVNTMPAGNQSDESVAVSITEEKVATAGVYLVITAEEVNEKYLRQSPADDATTAEKKSSRMQMLMAVANNITSGDAGIGDLRQIKDEIFALNFLERKSNRTEKN
jgi:hypothetical protein